MKSLRESLFDSDLINKDVTLDQYFDVSIDRHKESSSRTDNDKKIMKEMEKDINSLNLKSLDCESLIEFLANTSKKYTKDWNGGGYSYRIYDKSNRVINTMRVSLKDIDLFNDVSKIDLRGEDWDGNHYSYYTYFVLTRK